MLRPSLNVRISFLDWFSIPLEFGVTFGKGTCAEIPGSTLIFELSVSRAQSKAVGFQPVRMAGNEIRHC